MILKMIAAVGKNLELGKKDGVGSMGKKSGKGGMIWHLSGDLKYFKKTTGHDALLMGENTFRTLPAPLPGRKHIVLTLDRESKFPEGVEVFYSIEDFMKEYADRDETIWVSGGGQIYKLFLPYVQEIDLTEIDAEDSSAEVYFPEFSHEDFTREVVGSGEDNGIKYNFVRYIKK
jgi:dihydrofolate reductase